MDLNHGVEVLCPDCGTWHAIDYELGGMLFFLCGDWRHYAGQIGHAGQLPARAPMRARDTKSVAFGRAGSWVAPRAG